MWFSNTVFLRSSAKVAGLAGFTLVAAVAAGHAQVPQVPQAWGPAAEVAGIWIDDTGKGAIEIGPCNRDRLCGRIVWLREPADKAGKPLTDGLNSNASQRQRPICGLQVIGEVKRVGAKAWDEGWIYDPKQGKQFDVEIKPRGPDKLQVTGYLGVKFLSETFTWTRAPATLVRCDGSQGPPGSQATTTR